MEYYIYWRSDMRNVFFCSDIRSFANIVFIAWNSRTIAYLSKMLVLNKTDYDLPINGKPVYHQAPQASIYASILAEIGFPTLVNRLYRIKAKAIPKFFNSNKSFRRRCEKRLLLHRKLKSHHPQLTTICKSQRNWAFPCSMGFEKLLIWHFALYAQKRGLSELRLRESSWGKN